MKYGIFMLSFGQVQFIIFKGSEVQLGEGSDVCLENENTEQYEDADGKQ